MLTITDIAVFNTFKGKKRKKLKKKNKKFLKGGSKYFLHREPQNKR